MVKVVFLHPDLGIGGAERLVVDAGLALKAKGHEVTFVTSHHDKGHCFEETRNGTFPVVTVADWIPRSILGRCMALCAYVRMIVAALWLVTLSDLRPEVIIADQISACIPFVRLFSKAKIVFYCHFPDQLLTQRQTSLKSLYRMPIDWLEEVTTGQADKVLVNSRFTGGIFHDTFKSLTIEPDVLYPSLNTKQFDNEVQVTNYGDDTYTFLSINRYERKKNIKIAIKALAELKKSLNSLTKVQLIHAGGYDPRVKENIYHLKELEAIAEDCGVDVTFVQSISDHKKLTLLKSCDCLLYTPSGEHFGIVPLEAMYCKLPVIAVNDGGPTETVVDGETGFLVESSPEGFAEAMRKMVEGGRETKERFGEAGNRRVRDNFSFRAFTEKLNSVVTDV